MTAEPPFKADPDAPPTPVTFADIESAARTIEGVANRTPVVTSRTLNERLGVEAAFIKCENVQRTGAFKFRGAYTRISQMSATERGRGVVTYSSGNHALGDARAAQLLEDAGPLDTVLVPCGGDGHCDGRGRATNAGFCRRT